MANPINIPNLSPSSEKESLSTLFKVVIPETRDIVFRSCEGLESQIEVRYFYEGGRLSAPRTARGTQKVNTLSFGQGTTPKEAGGHSLFDWYQEVADPSKPLNKKTITVSATDAEGRTLAEWKVLNAWPCRWMAPLLSKEYSGLTMEYVSFAHEGISRVR